jgi:hypothetical protein
MSATPFLPVLFPFLPAQIGRKNKRKQDDEDDQDGSGDGDGDLASGGLSSEGADDDAEEQGAGGWAGGLVTALVSCAVDIDREPARGIER